jgi:glycosyltransferase involved in cell wall biosynthesis
MEKYKIAHLTSVHPPFDSRIFHKECKTLAKAGYEVVLIAPHDQDETVDDVKIRAISKPKRRRERMTRTAWHVYRTASQEHADLYHFHDPELIPVGVLLKIQGKKVIYDVHEDVPRQILTKHWIPHLLRKLVAQIAELMELVGTRPFNGITAATPTIAERFPPEKTVIVQNFPILNELTPAKLLKHTDKQNSPCIVYVGGLSITRGIKEMVQAMALLPESRRARLALAGTFQPPELEVELQQMPGWERMQFVGWQDRQGVAQLLSKAQIGLVMLHPIINYLDSYPVKLFEYMAAGLPVIASNFPLWKEIVEGNKCGLTVDPLNPEEIAQAIEYLLDHPKECQTMGENGRRAVTEKYNWEKESEKLLALYERILKR